MMMKIVLCGEIFSPNLGDGIIATGMRHLLSKAVAGVEIVPVDLAGRAQYPSLVTETAPSRHRGLLSQVNILLAVLCTVLFFKQIEIGFQNLHLQYPAPTVPKIFFVSGICSFFVAIFVEIVSIFIFH